MNKKRLSEVKNSLREKANLIIEELEKQGLKPLVTCGYRSEKEQDRLYALGRTKRGKIVTYAKGGQSKHNFRKAIDFAFVDKNGDIDWTMQNFKKLGIAAKKYGLSWGGDWKRFKDYPHIEVE